MSTKFPNDNQKYHSGYDFGALCAMFIQNYTSNTGEEVSDQEKKDNKILKGEIIDSQCAILLELKCFLQEVFVNIYIYVAYIADNSWKEFGKLV